MVNSFDDLSIPHNPPVPDTDPNAPRYVAIERAPKPRQIWPAASLIILALGVLTYRLSIADWHWDWPWQSPAASASVVVAAPANAPATVPKPAPDEDFPTPALAVEPVGPPIPETLAFVEPLPLDPEAQTPNPDLAAATPKPDDGSDLALSDIEQEAQRIRKEREELERFKEQAGKEIANAPRRPDFGRMPNPAFLARRQAEMEQLMMRQMEAHRRAVDRMLRAQGRPGARGRLPGIDDRFDRAFEQMRRDMQAFEREAEAAMLDQRNFAFGNPVPLGRRQLAIPPAPRLGDVPAPPEPANQTDNATKDNTNPDAPRPNLRRFSFTTPDGAQVQGFEIRSTFGNP